MKIQLLIKIVFLASLVHFHPSPLFAKLKTEIAQTKAVVYDTPPVAIPDDVTSAQNTTVTIMVLDNDIEGTATIDPQTVKLVDRYTGAPVLSVTVENQGTFNVDPLNGTIAFTPLTNFGSVVAPVYYTVKDINGVISNNARILVSVTPTLPIANPDFATTPMWTPVTLTVWKNDISGSMMIDPQMVKLIDPVTGLRVFFVNKIGEGLFSVNYLTGQVTFTPAAGFSGISTVNYVDQDLNGEFSNQAAITITVTPLVPPTAVPDVASTNFGTPVTLTVWSNDVPGSMMIDPQMVKLIDPVTGLRVFFVDKIGEGLFSVNYLTGQVTFTPAAGFSGISTVNYVDQDLNGEFSNQAAISITVTPLVPPTAVPDVVSTTLGTPVTITVWSNDVTESMATDPPMIKLIDPVTRLRVFSVKIPDQGIFSVNDLNGQVTFVPDAEFSGTSTVNYVSQDLKGEFSNEAVITVNVTATPLPVKLTIFKVIKEGKTAQLNWETTTETNSDHFEIQHSVTGKEWNNIGKVASHGESTVKNIYKFTDQNPVTGENLYRLKMIDKDASFAYSRIQSLKIDGLSISETSIFPNPSTNFIFIQNIDQSQIKRILIMDMNGRAVFSSINLINKEINVSNFLSGTYILQITNTNGSVSNHKIVITH